MEEVRIQIERLKERIIREYNPEKIILFGSLARGDYHELSDIDMVVIKKQEEDFWRELGMFFS